MSDADEPRLIVPGLGSFPLGPTYSTTEEMEAAMARPVEFGNVEAVRIYDDTIDGSGYDSGWMLLAGAWSSEGEELASVTYRWDERGFFVVGEPEEEPGG